jgi:ribulose 1,5-bisphosphate carboxylase large subunit-like protein
MPMRGIGETNRFGAQSDASAQPGPLVAAGADFLAVSAGVWQHPDGPGAAVKAFHAAIAAAQVG